MAINVADRFFLSIDCQQSAQIADIQLNFSKFDFSVRSHERALFEITLLLIASKQEELDENIPQVKDLIRYYARFLPGSTPLPTFSQVVECERLIMRQLDWHLSFITPSIIVRLMLASGVIFSGESLPKEQLRSLAMKVPIKCSFYLD